MASKKLSKEVQWSIVFLLLFSFVGAFLYGVNKRSKEVQWSTGYSALDGFRVYSGALTQLEVGIAMKLSRFFPDVRASFPEVQTLYEKLVFSYSFDDDERTTEPLDFKNYWIRTETNHNAFVQNFVLDESTKKNNGVLATLPSEPQPLQVLNEKKLPQKPSQVRKSFTQFVDKCLLDIKNCVNGSDDALNSLLLCN